MAYMHRQKGLRVVARAAVSSDRAWCAGWKRQEKGLGVEGYCRIRCQRPLRDKAEVGSSHLDTNLRGLYRI